MTQAISTREGWSAFVSESLDKPIPITRAELDAMSPADRAMNREARKQFMIRGPVVNTAQFAAIETEILRRLMLNQYKSHGKLGVIVSGEPNIGKTTTVSHIARRFERRRRDIGRASGGNSIPVIYVSVPPSCTPKLMLGEFAHFLGLPVRAHYNTGELMNTVASVIAACGTELIIVDEIHNINQKYKQMGEASDTLKQLSEKCPGTFVYAGVDVEASGLLDGTRGRQISSRFDILNLHKFENTGEGQSGMGRSARRGRELPRTHRPASRGDSAPRESPPRRGRWCDRRPDGRACSLWRPSTTAPNASTWTPSSAPSRLVPPTRCPRRHEEADASGETCARCRGPCSPSPPRPSSGIGRLEPRERSHSPRSSAARHSLGCCPPASSLERAAEGRGWRSSTRHSRTMHAGTRCMSVASTTPGNPRSADVAAAPKGRELHVVDARGEQTSVRSREVESGNRHCSAGILTGPTSTSPRSRNTPTLSVACPYLMEARHRTHYRRAPTGRFSSGLVDRRAPRRENRRSNGNDRDRLARCGQRLPRRPEVRLTAILTDLSFASYLLSPRFSLAEQVWALEAAVVTVMHGRTGPDPRSRLLSGSWHAGRWPLMAFSMRQNANNKRPCSRHLLLRPSGTEAACSDTSAQCIQIFRLSPEIAVPRSRVLKIAGGLCQTSS